jgi:regulator of replication initiation timing
MKKLLFLNLICVYLLAYDDIDTKTAFDVLMFKTGVTSLTKDFENEKINISNNSKEIEILKKEVQYLLQENMKLKLGAGDSKLEDENRILKDQLEKLKTSQHKTKYLNAIVSDKIASSVASPYPNSEKVKYYNKSDPLKIDFCNKFGWCKIANKNEYIAQYKIYFITE